MPDPLKILQPLERSFFEPEAAVVARSLLGQLLVREISGVRLTGVITETEAYQGEEDAACHARVGRTARTEALYGFPGQAYIYFTYGMHWCLNAVCQPAGQPAAVLLRAIRPVEGLERIQANRPGVPPRDWCSGPARLCKALEITGALYGTDLTAKGGLYLAAGQPIPDALVRTSPRIGISYAAEPWRSILWRFWVDSVV